MINQILRIIDILISIFFLLVFFPIIFLISILIFLVDGRPIFFKQTRVGYMGKQFTILKFRTMKNINKIHFIGTSGCPIRIVLRYKL